MSKRLITLEVDSDVCFEAIGVVGSLDGIGFRLSDAFLVGTMPRFIDAIGLSMYGIVVTDMQPVPVGSSTGDDRHG